MPVKMEVGSNFLQYPTTASSYIIIESCQCLAISTSCSTRWSPWLLWRHQISNGYVLFYFTVKEI